MSDRFLARRFADWGIGFDLSKAPGSVVTAARRAIFDTIGVIAAGSSHKKVKALAQVIPGTGLCNIIGTDALTSAESAALVHGMAAHVWDFDDTSYTGIMHGSAVVLPAVLAVAQEVDASSDDLLAAFIVGSEITYTLADICTHRHYFSGWWSTATFSSIGAVVAVCRLLGLDAEKTAHAVGMTATGAGVNKAHMGTDTKPYMVGEAAQRSITFARAAAAGLSGPVNAFEHESGYFHMLNGDISMMGEADSLGQRWRLTDPGLLFKLNPVCSAAHAAIEQMAKLLKDARASAKDIQLIRAEVPELVHISLVFPEPTTPQEAQFSLPYTLACAALYGCVRLEDLEEQELSKPDKKALMAKVSVEVAADLSTDKMRAKYPESARLTVTLSNGDCLSGFCAEAYGMPARPLTDDELTQKFKRCVMFSNLPDQKYSLQSVDYLQLISDLTPAGQEYRKSTQLRRI